MKQSRWLVVLVLLAGVCASGYYLGRGNVFWERFKSELFVTLLVAGREDALTEKGKVYFNQLIDMNTHGYLMNSKTTLRGKDRDSIENSLVRLLVWKSKNGFALWLPEPVAPGELEFDMPSGKSKDSYSLEHEYEVYRERLDEFTKPHLKKIELMSAGKQAPVTGD